MDLRVSATRLTCNRNTRYRLSKSTSISDASGGNRDIGFGCRSQLRKLCQRVILDRVARASRLSSCHRANGGSRVFSPFYLFKVLFSDSLFEISNWGSYALLEKVRALGSNIILSILRMITWCDRWLRGCVTVSRWVSQYILNRRICF